MGLIVEMVTDSHQDLVDSMVKSKRSLDQLMIKHDVMYCINQPSLRYVEKDE